MRQLPEHGQVDSRKARCNVGFCQSEVADEGEESAVFNADFQRRMIPNQMAWVIKRVGSINFLWVLLDFIRIRC